MHDTFFYGVKLMVYKEVTDQDKLIEETTNNLYRLAILAEEERINKMENKNSSEFSFRTEFFQKVLNHIK